MFLKSYSLKCLIFYLALTFSAYGQMPNLKFEHFNDEKGLTQNSIVDLVQDDDGYLWIGTANGLYKYDGLRFTIYRNDLNSSNSLVNNSINKLKTDTKGNIWIGTSRGLCRFNKITQTFKTFPSILNNKTVTAIEADKDGSIWIGTNQSGLYHLMSPNSPNEKIEHYFHQPNQPNNINDNEILSIIQSKNGNLWVGTGKGLNKMTVSKSGKDFILIEQITERVNTLFEDKKGNLWVGGEGSKLYSLDRKSSSNVTTSIDFKKHVLDKNATEKLYDGVVYGIQEEEDGDLWIAIHGYGLYWYNPETRSQKLYAPDRFDESSLSRGSVKTLLLDSTNVLWIGTFIGGLNKCDLETKAIQYITRNNLKTNTLSDPSVNCILEDSNKTYWVGTETGLNKIRFSKSGYKEPTFEHYLLDENELSLKSGSLNQVWCIYKDKDNDYWIGENDGITHMRVDPISMKPTFTPTGLKTTDVYSIVEDSQGYIWFGSSSEGLIKWKKKKTNNTFNFSKTTRYKPDFNNLNSISDDLISCLYKDSEDNIWIGTLLGGLNLFVPGNNKNEDKFISYQYNPENTNSLSQNSVFTIHEDKNKTYWIGTFGGGLNKMTFTDSKSKLEPTFERYTEKNGLSNNAIYGIVESDDNKLWMSTDDGLSCYSPETYTFKNYSKQDGLQSNNFRRNAYFKNQEGYLFFGGLKGLNIFHPDNLKDNAFKPPVKITNFSVNNEVVIVGNKNKGKIILEKRIPSLDKKVTLKYDENTLTFEFAALHFAAPQKNKFKYKLEGFDKGWVDSKGLPFAHYTNLSSGNYNFKVKASNNDGVWNNTPAEMKFLIHPPFWLSWWAYIIYASFIVMALMAIQSYYHLQSKEKTAIKVQEEIKAVNKLKLQFFTNITHDFKTPITLILNPLEEIIEYTKGNLSITPQLKTIERNANYLLRLVNQLMEFRKIEVGETKLAVSKSNIINFVREITFSFRTLANKKDIELSFESQLYTSEVWFDWDKLEKILNNLIFNALKFTDDNGQITVKVSKPQNETIYIEERQVHAEYVQITVEDNGLGISQDQLPFVFQRFYQVNKENNESNTGSGIGLAITKDLVDLHHGTIELDSKEGTGSRFIIKLPLGNKHLLKEEIVEHTIPDLLTEDELIEEDHIIENKSSNNLEDSQTKNSVLVVDDNADIRALVTRGLSNKYRVFEAKNGKEALNVALKEMPDLVVSDVLMPEMDGIEFCYELKNNIRTSHIPVILLTALNSVEHRIKGLESGADAYIPKPFKMKLLSVRVEKLITSREQMRKHFLSEEHLTPEYVALNSLDKEFLDKIMKLMEEHMDDETYQVNQLSSDMYTSKSTFFRKLKKLTGQGPNDFIRMVRLKRAAQLLSQNQLTVSEVSLRVGFPDPNYFGKCFRKQFGETPSKYASKTREPS